MLSQTGEVYVYTQTHGLLLEKQKLLEEGVEVVDVEITADGQWLMVVAANNVMVHKWMEESGKFVLYQEVKVEEGERVLDGAICGNHEAIALARENGRVLILNFRKSLFVMEVLIFMTRTIFLPASGLASAPLPLKSTIILCYHAVSGPISSGRFLTSISTIYALAKF